MRRNKYLMTGVLLLILSLILVRAYLHRERHARAREESAVLRDVVVARQTIPKWAMITPEMIELQKVDPTREMVPQDALTSLDAAQGKFTR
ncbi:MAG TPA: SAF domain-containing protein, partial [Armatimonadota bacterium]|nr:SAF domain-containing protein [Armatimonadota bacterium]